MSTATSKLSIKDASLWSHTYDTTNFKHTVSTTASATVHTVQVLQYKYYSTVQYSTVVRIVTTLQGEYYQMRFTFLLVVLHVASVTFTFTLTTAFAFAPTGHTTTSNTFSRRALPFVNSNSHANRNTRTSILSTSSNGIAAKKSWTQSQSPSQSQSLTALESSATSTSSMPRLSTNAIQQLDKDGYMVLEDWLPQDLVKELRQDIQNLRSNGKFNIAKIGQDSTNTLNTDIRIAETCFLGKAKQTLKDVKSPNDSRSRLYSVLENMRMDLSGNDMLDRNDENGELIKAAPALDASLSELLYAYYPRGGFYRRHTDAVIGSASVLRSYSLLIYLNNEWTEADGGCLRLHLDSGKDFLPPGEEPNYVNVQPKGGTLVLFRSEQVPHEVLDTEAERMAIVGWYNRPVTSADLESLASEGDKMRSVMLLVAAGLVTFGLGSIIIAG